MIAVANLKSSDRRLYYHSAPRGARYGFGTAQPSLCESVFRWLRDVVDHEIGHGLVRSF